MEMHEAACSCGQLRVTAQGEPVRVSICHCLECQRRTGSAFGYQARWPKEHVRITGRSTEFVRTSDDGAQHTFRFCPDCGSTVYWKADRAPGLVGVAVGAIADPAYPAPVRSVYEQSKHAWVHIDGPGVEHFGQGSVAQSK